MGQMVNRSSDRWRRKRLETKGEPIPENVKDNFMDWVEEVPETGCWEWKLSRQNKRGGYGQKTINYQLYRSHRLSWMIFRGEIPEGMFVCHSCDNPPCCNPDHLFLGTPKDNQNDAWNKGRLPLPTNAPIGSNSIHAKLSESDVYEIRDRFDAGDNRYELARVYNVDRATIYDIGGRKTWKHLKEI